MKVNVPKLKSIEPDAKNYCDMIIATLKHLY